MDFQHVMRLTRILLILLLSTVVVACAAQRETQLATDTAELTKATEEGDFERLLQEAEEHWQNRVDKASVEKAIATWERAARTGSPNLSEEERKDAIAGIWESVALGYYLLADSHLRLEKASDEKVMGIYEKGVGAAERALALRDPNFTRIVAADMNKWQSAVKDANEAAIPALYWYATNLGRWALLEGIATILARRADVEATMRFIVEKDETYYHAAPHRYFGVFHTRIPIGGGDPPKSKASFERSLELAPNYLATRVVMAENYAVLVGDRELFESLLRQVLDAPDNIDPSVDPDNALEKLKAQQLLDQADEFFY